MRDLSRFDNSRFDRGAPRWKEWLWYLVRALFFQNSLPFPSFLRIFFLRLFGARVGRGVVVRGGVTITFPWRLEIGNHSWIGEQVFILSLASVLIESNVCVSQRAFLCTGSHDHRSLDFRLVTKPITLREGSWVAAQAFVGPGVEIGAGSIVAAGAVVWKPVPAGVIVRAPPSTVEEIPCYMEKWKP
jgi:putative colanic acid biosynthesis acetyltransferase WcaF